MEALGLCRTLGRHAVDNAFALFVRGTKAIRGRVRVGIFITCAWHAWHAWDDARDEGRPGPLNDEFDRARNIPCGTRS